MNSLRHHGRYSMNIAMERDRLQGWLSVATVLESESVDHLEWHRRYCVLVKDERTLYFYNDTESVLGRHSPVKFTLSGDETQDGQCLTTLSLLDPNYTASSSGGNSSHFQRGTRQSRSFREKVQSSLQRSFKKTSLSSRGDDRLSGGSVRVSRSKSFGKNDQIVNSPSSSATMKLGSSVENLLLGGGKGGDEGTFYPSIGDHGTHLDLTTKGLMNIAPVHQSVSPRHSCFRIITESEVLYASCGSQEELDRWVTGLTDCHSPNRDHVRRVDSQLSVWIMEARAFQPKKRYYCEISLNGVLYSRTCSKPMNEILFWGEPFHFEGLPTLGSVTVKVYRENYNKKKKERSDTDIGKIEIPAIVLQNGQFNEEWHPLAGPPAGGLKGVSSGGRPSDIPSIRIKLLYKTVSIMPLKVYDDFLLYLKTDYGTMCEVLEPVIPAKAKDDIATTLVRILQSEGKAREFICDIIMSEVQEVENENLIFRGNTFATKAVDTYMKMVGVAYLQESLAPFIHTLMDEYTEEECEVDPTKLPSSGSLSQNQATLIALVSRAWGDILKSYNKFPSDLQLTLNSIRQRFGSEREEACFKLISGSIFLRFFCPALLSPNLFHLCQEYPDEKMARKLTLVAKVIQNLANFTRFGVKEEYMCFMNEYLEKEIKNMKQFIDTISSPLVGNHIVPWGPQRVDLGREASIMHGSLTKLLASVNLSQTGVTRIEPLVTLLQDISQTSQEDAADPFSSTFEALRTMKSVLSKFDSEFPTPLPVSSSSPSDPAHSDTSSEYTTPAQSQTTSPTREASPSATSESMMKGLQALGLAEDQSTSTSSNSLRGTSPTIMAGGGASLSSLATHSSKATRKDKTQTLPVTSRSAGRGGGGGGGGGGGDVTPTGGDPRRLSDSALQRLSVQRGGQEVPLRDLITSEDSSQLRTEVMRLAEQVHQLQSEKRNEQETAEREIRRLHTELKRNEERARKSEQDLQHHRESRGKILRGLNTQTEITLVQLRRDFDFMKTQLEAKDEIIAVQEKKIASLADANVTLRSGLHDLLTLPKDHQSGGGGGGDDGGGGGGGEGEVFSGESVSNGHSNSSPGTHSDDLHRIISLLDSGKFDQS